MLDALYNAAEGMLQATTDFETVSHNLANVGTAGFRRLVPQHSETQVIATNGNGAATPFQMDHLALDLQPGPLVQTDSVFDIALDGPGFIELDGPNGSIFTRDGRMHVNSDGVLVANSGLTVQGDGGPIKIPKDAESISINGAGTVFADNVEIGTISIKEPTNPGAIVRAGESTYEIEDAKPAEETSVLQGYHEGSNVSAVLELVRMIEAMRRYEAAQKTITSVSEAVQRHTTS